MLKPQDRSQQMSFGSENSNGQAGKKLNVYINASDVGWYDSDCGTLRSSSHSVIVVDDYKLIHYIAAQ